MATESQCPVKHETSLPGTSSGCPVKHDRGGLNETNHIPADLNNLPAPDQRMPLNTNRTVSSIPKGDGGRWEYPSPQQFHNALRRKNMQTEEEHVETMVLIHNFLNERCWREVLRWEQMRPVNQTQCRNVMPMLYKFQGRPQDPTPKARILSFLGISPKPFDTHEWYVKRCDGTSRRYVIDYYGGEGENEGVFHCDVRPALETLDGWIDRTKWVWRNWTENRQTTDQD